MKTIKVVKVEKTEQKKSGLRQALAKMAGKRNQSSGPSLRKAARRLKAMITGRSR